MPVSLARKGIWIAGTVLVLVALIVAGLPYVASTQIVRDSIAYQMSAWSGYRVRLDDVPEIQVWPTFRAVLNDVTLLDWNEADPQTVLSVERVEMDLSAIAALRGEVTFTRMRLSRPTLFVKRRDGALHLPPPQDWGRLARSVAAARQIVSAAPGQPDINALPDDILGIVEFSQGRLIASGSGQQTDILTSASGTLDWPALNRQASLSASAIWHGENVALTASSAQPLILLGGGTAPVDLALEAAPANASFKGNASLAGLNFVNGEFSVAAPSLGGLLEWTHALTIPTGRLGPVAMSARVVGDVRRIKFEETTLSVHTSTGRGLLDLSFGEGTPLIAGTLAFDTLNLRALLNAFSPFSAGPLAASDTPVSGGSYDFDLRLSATNATYGSVPLANIAAAARVKDGLAAFDISDATVFGGALQFGLRAGRTGEDNAVEIRMAGEQINTGSMADALGIERLVPEANGSFSLVLKGIGRDLQTVLETSVGNVSASFGRGSVPGLSLDALLQRSSGGDFFPLSEIEGDALPLDGAELKAGIANGVAQLEKAEFQSGQYVVSLDGLVPFAGRALALYGTVTAPEGTDERLKSPLMFFVGGSWSAPFIASFMPPSRDAE